MKYALAILFTTALTVQAQSSERARCPMATQQQATVMGIVSQKIGIRIDADMVANDQVIKSDIDKARKTLLTTELWALDLGDEQLKEDYLCAIMQLRRNLDEAALEFVDHHEKERQDKLRQQQAIPTPPK